ncbi:MAG: acetoacetate--CoA ligase [Gammaproteobacteria bacterium]|nr:acetoacetate--CoA ligase [Gammaproteobacteria bacterium]
MNSEALLWKPSDDAIASSNLATFAGQLDLPLDYPKLYEWSIQNREAFWRTVWEFTGIVGSPGASTLSETLPFADSAWFNDARLNFAENLLKYDDERTALVEVNETDARVELTYAQLRARVAAFALELKRFGITKNDRVAAWLPNSADTVIAMLATTSIGAIWSSCSPDFGVEGAFDRFSQIEPKLLLVTDQYQYNGRTYDVSKNVQSLTSRIASIENVLRRSNSPDQCHFQQIYRNDSDSLSFERLPFNHPLYIMFSSGTTGIPKCIVHGAGGTLIQHVKEHQLHADLTREDVLFFFTTTGWMMWNWLVSGLATGCTLVLYDGSPFFPRRNTLIDLIDRESISVFGVGAKYVSSIERVQVKPRETHELSSLRSILTTGSPLSHESFDYVYRDFKKDVWLASISGGTDLISCFVLGNPFSGVCKGEIQGPGLGMATSVFDDTGQSINDQKGELVCTKSFPSAPIGFWNDADGSRYHDAYFARFENTWAHGDFAEINSTTGGYVIHGRSDAVLNPGGVRIGTAEIYRQLERFDEVVDAVCVGQEWENDTRIVLFVVLTNGLRLNKYLRKDIRAAIRSNASPRHVPAKIEQVGDVPRTRSGKIAELAVREIIHGREVRNTTALENPECLVQFKGHEALET